MRFRAMAGPFSVMLILLALVVTGYAQQTCTESYGKGPQHVQPGDRQPGRAGAAEGTGRGVRQETQHHAVLGQAGTGESMQLLKDKKVDMIMVHAPAAEKKSRGRRLGNQAGADWVERVLYRRAAE